MSSSSSSSSLHVVPYHLRHFPSSTPLSVLYLYRVFCSHFGGYAHFKRSELTCLYEREQTLRALPVDPLVVSTLFNDPLPFAVPTPAFHTGMLPDRSYVIPITQWSVLVKATYYQWFTPSPTLIAFVEQFHSPPPHVVGFLRHQGEGEAKAFEPLQYHLTIKTVGAHSLSASAMEVFRALLRKKIEGWTVEGKGQMFQYTKKAKGEDKQHKDWIELYVFIEADKPLTESTLSSSSPPSSSLSLSLDPTLSLDPLLFSPVIQSIRICEELSLTPPLSHTYSLVNRRFIGPTSIPADLAFLYASHCLARPGSIIYDPFCGTGSLLISAGLMGAHTVGSDFDYRILHGIKKGKYSGASIMENFYQYGVNTPELICQDLSMKQWRGSELYDGIVCDPPYGIRAGARKSGRDQKDKEQRESKQQKKHNPTPEENKDNETNNTSRSQQVNKSPNPTRAAGCFVPPTQLYDVEDVISDLLDLSARTLKVGGRLVYILPSTSDFSVDDIPSHPLLCIKSVCEQTLRINFIRRFITMEKIKAWDEVKWPSECYVQRRGERGDVNAPKYVKLKQMIDKYDWSSLYEKMNKENYGNENINENSSNKARKINEIVNNNSKHTKGKMHTDDGGNETKDSCLSSLESPTADLASPSSPSSSFVVPPILNSNRGKKRLHKIMLTKEIRMIKEAEKKGLPLPATTLITADQLKTGRERKVFVQQTGPKRPVGIENRSEEEIARRTKRKVILDTRRGSEGGNGGIEEPEGNDDDEEEEANDLVSEDGKDGTPQE